MRTTTAFEQRQIDTAEDGLRNPFGKAIASREDVRNAVITGSLYDLLAREGAGDDVVRAVAEIPTSGR